MQLRGMRAEDEALQLLRTRAGPAPPARGPCSPQVGALVDRVPGLRPQRGGVILASC